jgi:WD40 repeat protein
LFFKILKYKNERKKKGKYNENARYAIEKRTEKENWNQIAHADRADRLEQEIQHMARVDDESVQAMAMGKVFKDNVRPPPPKSCTRFKIISQTIEYGDMPYVVPCDSAHALWCAARRPLLLAQTSRINSLDFYKTGEHLVTASDDESIHVYNAVSGKYALAACSLAPSPLSCGVASATARARALSLSLSACVSLTVGGARAERRGRC